jgi:hypothetical protein
MYLTVFGRKLDLAIILSRVVTVAGVISAYGEAIGAFHIPVRLISLCGSIVMIYNFLCKCGLAPAGLVRPVEETK